MILMPMKKIQTFQSYSGNLFLMILSSIALGFSCFALFSFLFFSPQKFASYIQNEVDSGTKIDGPTVRNKSSAGSKTKQKRIPPTLKFESRFESGNLRSVEQVNTIFFKEIAFIRFLITTCICIIFLLFALTSSLFFHQNLHLLKSIEIVNTSSRFAKHPEKV